jgi:hypothetical protein
MELYIKEIFSDITYMSELPPLFRFVSLLRKQNETKRWG